MRSRSTLQTLIEETLNELEYELESEAGIEFQTSPDLNLYKWEIYTAEDLSGDKWCCHSTKFSPDRMTGGDADAFGDDLLRKAAPNVGPFDERVGFIRYVFTDKGATAEKSKQIIVLTKKISNNPRLRDKMTKERRCPNQCSASQR